MNHGYWKVLAALLSAIGAIIGSGFIFYHIGKGQAVNLPSGKPSSEQNNLKEQARAMEEKIEQLENQLRDCRGQDGTDAGATLSDSSATKAAPADGQIIDSFESEFFRIELRQCEREGQTVVCEFFILSKDRNRLLDAKSKTRAISNQGEVYLVSRQTVLGRSGKGLSNLDLPADVAVKWVVSFNSIPSDLNQFPLIELRFGSGFKGYQIAFNNIPVR